MRSTPTRTPSPRARTRPTTQPPAPSTLWAVWKIGARTLCHNQRAGWPNTQTNPRPIALSTPAKGSGNRAGLFVYGDRERIGPSPGTEHIFDDGNIGRILRGDQFIDTIPVRFRRAMVDKHITRLVKNENGGAFATISNVADVIKLAGRGGAFDSGERVRRLRRARFRPRPRHSTRHCRWPRRCATPAFHWCSTTKLRQKARRLPDRGLARRSARRIPE